MYFRCDFGKANRALLRANDRPCRTQLATVSSAGGLREADGSMRESKILRLSS